MQDGDLFAYCLELMTDEEKTAFGFEVEPRKPDFPLETWRAFQDNPAYIEWKKNQPVREFQQNHIEWKKNRGK
jgi:hypothetical protein